LQVAEAARAHHDAAAALVRRRLNAEQDDLHALHRLGHPDRERHRAGGIRLTVHGHPP